jgi:hypothetical protein
MEINKKDDTTFIQEDDRCDLDPTKICDNCCKCIESDKKFGIIKITKIISDED